MQTTNLDVEVLLPAHNEADSIEATIREIYGELSKHVNVGFIICEDGSRDNTKQILRDLSLSLPLRLNLSDERKGYSRAVREGFEMLEAPYLLCLDSDGQCDPQDFERFWQSRQKADVIAGWRVSRQDTLPRRLMSRFFYLIYQSVFRAPVHDPSCPFVLVPNRVAKALASELGIVMQQGFWWEFIARVHRREFSIFELPVNHRLRTAGTTQVYKVNKMAGIFCRHVLGIFEIDRQTRKHR